MEIVTLKTGVHPNETGTGKKRGLLFSCPEICSAVVLIKGKKNIIVDTGNFFYAAEIKKALESKGRLKAAQIDYVVNTHNHLDHCGCNFLFPTALVINHRSIWYPDGSLEVYENSSKLKVPGIEVIDTPGHLYNHVSVATKIADRTYVIAGDAVREDVITEKQNFTYMNTPEYIASRRMIFDLADVIIPGHGRTIEGGLKEKLEKLI